MNCELCSLLLSLVNKTLKIIRPSAELDISWYFDQSEMLGKIKPRWLDVMAPCKINIIG